MCCGALALTIFPGALHAEVIPESSDVVLLYDAGENEPDLEQQSKHNYMFTVDGDSTIYPCEANYCSLSDLKDRGEVTMTIYKLPEGFPRASNVVDPAKLAEYRDSAEQQYSIEEIRTDLLPDDEGRPYQTINLSSDGTFELDNAVYNKPELNNKSKSDADGFWQSRNVLAIIFGVVAAISIVVGGFYLRKYLRAHAARW